ncbi:MAG: signal peptidase II [Neisseriaceae bacterium]|nr:signal peptidase II [Neisseriaceae bacterium]
MGIFICILFDQISKFYFENQLYYREVVPIIPHFFNVTLAYNPGAAFSFLADAGGWQKYFFFCLALGVSLYLGILIFKRKLNVLMTYAASLIISGALGNAIDRVIHGHVIDFLDFYINSSHWPAFNLADSFIFIGAVLMFVDGFFFQSTSSK